MELVSSKFSCVLHFKSFAYYHLRFNNLEFCVDSATDSSVDKIEKNEEESKVMKDQDSKEKLEEGMEVAKEEKSSIEEPKKEEKKSEAESTDVEMKPAEPESVAVNESQQDGTTVPSTTVSPVSVVQVCFLSFSM